jgi:hypothetical protein
MARSSTEGGLADLLQLDLEARLCREVAAPIGIHELLHQFGVSRLKLCLGVASAVGELSQGVGGVVVRKIIAAFSSPCAAPTLNRSPVEIRRAPQWLR